MFFTGGVASVWVKNLTNEVPFANAEVLLFILFSLVFLKPNLDRLDFFDLMWIVGITDFVLKYLTIALKCLVVAMPKIVLAVKSKVK